MQPNSTLETVADYVSDARTLLQDKIAPYRYDDASLLVALNVTLLEARRLRPDLFVYKSKDKVPSFAAVDTSVLSMEPAFRLAIVYGVVGHAIARDQEDVQDARSTAFMGTFNSMLVGNGTRVIAGGSPPGGGKQ